MMRKTVKFTTPDHPQERAFHLHADKAERFAAKVIADGGTAKIVPLELGSDLCALLRNAGVDPVTVR